MFSLGRSGSFTSKPADERRAIRALVCEDDRLIAHDLMVALETAGIEALGPATTFEMALQCAEMDDIDAAIVDLNLTDGRTGVALARRLHDLGVAVVLCSSDCLEPRELDDIPHIFAPKPMAAEVLRECIEKLIASRSLRERAEAG